MCLDCSIIIVAYPDGRNIMIFATAEGLDKHYTDGRCALATTLSGSVNKILQGRGFSDCMQCEKCGTQIDIHATREYTT